jgi:hypothetical protein
LEAAEELLERESPSTIREEAKVFLTMVYEDPDINERLRIEAARIARKTEARKVTLPSVMAAEERSVPRSRELAQRLRALLVIKN